MQRTGLTAALILIGWGTISSAQFPPINPSGDYAVVDFGAKCDGSDDTSAIQATIAAAFPGGTVVFPAQRCAIGSTLTVGDPTTQQRTSFISLRGANPITSQLAWIGSSSGVALRFVQNKYFTVQGLGLLNLVSRGATVGLVLGGYGTAGGTETLQGDLRQVNISGFSTDLQAGDGASASSEMHYDHLELTNADVCWTTQNFNTLNHLFTMLSLSGCGVGLKQTVGNVAVRGGSTSGNGLDFWASGNAFDVQDVRAEQDPGSTFVYGNPYHLRVVHNLVTGDTGPTTRALWLTVIGAATIEGNRFATPIYLDTYVYPGALVLTNNLLRGPSGTDPVVWAHTYGYTHFVYTGNGNEIANTRYPDTSGVK